MPVAARRRRRATETAETAGEPVGSEALDTAGAVQDLAELDVGDRPELVGEPEPVLGWGAHAYRVRLRTDHDTWGATLVSRAAGPESSGAERAWLGVVRAAGFPAPDLVARDMERGVLVFRQPAGVPLAERMLAEMMSLPQLLAGFGRLHARLHTVPVPVGGLPPGPGPGLGDVDALAASSADPPVAEAVGEEVAWLARHRPAEGPAVVCHGELNPVQVYSDGRADDARSVAVHWARAGAGDAELDVAATLTGFWSGALYIDSAVQRRMYRMARDPLASGYLTGYQAAAARPLDDGRLRYWQAYHLCRLAADIARCAAHGPQDEWDPAAAVVQPRAALAEIRRKVRELAATVAT